MPTAKATPTTELASHDVTLSNGVERIGLLFRDGPRVLQEIPISEGSRPFNREQKSWFSGMSRLRYEDDPMGYWDAYAMWTMTDGKLFPMPQWFWSKGFRSADYSMPGDVTYQKVDTYISIKFTASASYSADKMLLWLDWEGTPTTLAYALMSDTAGSPNAVLKSGTLAYTSATKTGPTEIDWTTTQALVSGTAYHIRIYNAGSANDYWKVATDADGAGSKTSADGSTNWTAAAYSMYYRVTDAETKRQFVDFTFKDATYAVTINDDVSASTLYINGDRFKATSATATSVTDTSSGVSTGWTADQWIGAYIRIVAGTGAGQVRVITDNDTTSVTVATWDKTPSTDSECVIYSTPIWQSFTSGLGAVTGKPLVIGDVVYFPQGTTAIHKMKLDYTAAIQHALSADSTNTADKLAVYFNPSAETEVWGTDDDASKVKYSVEKTYATTLSFSDWKKIGSSPKITNVLGGNKLYVFKEDGFWTINPSRSVVPQWTRDDSIDPNNGKAAMAFNNELWFSWATSLQRHILETEDVGDMLLYRAGTQGLPRPGLPVDAAFGIGWRFFVIDGGTSGTSSVIVFNNYGYQEVFRAWKTGVRIRNAFWQSCPGTRNRLWFDVNGELAYIEFPLFAANPRRDTSLTYQHYSEFVTSIYDMNEVTLDKLLSLVRVVLEDKNGKVVVEYQFDNEISGTTWHKLGEIINDVKPEFSMNLGNIKEFRLRFRIYTTTATTPPVIEAYEVSGWIANPLKYQWVSSFKVDTNQVTKAGDPDFSPDAIVKFLQNAAERAEAITMRSVIPTMDDKKVIVTAPVIHKNWIRPEDGKPTWGGSVDIAFREV